MTCGLELSPARTVARRKMATLVFCDVSGSTALGERVDAESVRDAMSMYFREMRAAIERHGGMVEKFIGDAVVAVFGVPRAHEDDALRAVRAAWEMRARMRGLQPQLVERYGVGLVVRIGVNTGEVVAGDASSRQTVVTGDAVNVAARLEQSAAPDEILIGELTLRLVATSVSAVPVGPLALKGKSDPLPAFQLIDIHVAPGVDARAPLVGRADEMTGLLQAFDEVTRANTCRLVTVVGEPGVGKSRLAWEFLDGLPQGSTVLRGRCLSYGQGITYWPLGEIVRTAAGIKDVDSAVTARAKVAGIVAESVDADFVASRIEQAIGLTAGQASVDEIALASRRLIKTVARDGSAVIVVDDLQWAEPALLDLIGSFPRLITDASILVLCLARPELLDAHPDWPAPVVLQPLDAAESKMLAAHLVAGVGADLAAAGRIVEVAQGNPLFVEELVAYLHDGEGVRGLGGDLSARLAETALPPSLGGVLAARLDALAASDRSWLEAGAVEGEVFHSGAAARLLQTEDEPHNPHLDRLLAGRFVRPETPTLPSASAFHFHHVLMRDAAYNSAGKRMRADLHERFADWLETAVGERLAEYREILAHHLERSHQYLGDLGPPDERQQRLAHRATDHLRPAADRALARSDLPAASRLLSRLDGLLESGSPERAGVLLALAFCLWSTSQIQAAQDALSEAAVSSAAAGDVAGQWHVAVEQACLNLMVDPGNHSLQGILELAERAIQVLGPMGTTNALTRAWRAVGDATSSIGQCGRAITAYHRSAETAKASADTGQEMFALQQLLIALIFGPTPVDEAITLAERISARAPDNRLLQASARFSIGVHQAMRDRFAQAQSELSLARGMLTELDLTLYLANDAIFLSGYVDLLHGHYQKAESRVRECLDVLERAGERAVVSSGLAVLAQTAYALGDIDQAMAMSASSRKMASEDDLHVQVTTSGVQALVLCRRNQLSAAEDEARHAEALVAPSDWLDLRADTQRILSDVMAAAGRLDESVRYAEAALTLYLTKGNLVKARRTRRRLDRLKAKNL